MRAMSFYIGSTVFEIQRGWVVNLGGQKMILEEDVSQEIPNSGCNIAFTNLHLVLNCPNFIAYYDGVMAGHIKIKAEAPNADAFGKSMGSFGLCYDAQSGFRKNWQVGNTKGNCEVNTEAGACGEADADNCSGYQFPARFGGGSTEKWGSCGNGVTSSCNELYCGDDVASSAQQCALNQADRVSCELKYGEMSVAQDAGCPDDECSWKLDLVSRGCPQENLPFVC